MRASSHTAPPVLCVLLILLAFTSAATRTDAAPPGSFVQAGTATRAQGASSQVRLELAGQIGGLISAIAVDGDRAYLGLGARVAVVDVSVPSSLAVVGQTAVLSGRAEGVAISAGYLFVAAGAGGLRVLSLSEPTHPIEVGAYGGRAIHAVAVRGPYLYGFGFNDALLVFDISEPTQPELVGSHTFDPMGPPTILTAQRLAVAGDYAFVAAGTQGLWVIDVSEPTAPVEVGESLPPPVEPSRVGLMPQRFARYARSVAVNGGYAYVGYGLGALYDLVGVAIVDVSDPTAPKQVGFLRGGPEGSLECAGLGLALSEGFLYVAGHRLRAPCLDVANVTDPSKPLAVARTAGFYTTVAVDGARLYAADETSLHVLDLADPGAPVELGAVTATIDAPG